MDRRSLFSLDPANASGFLVTDADCVERERGAPMTKLKQQVEFSELWTEIQPTVAAYVRAVVRDSHAANDIVQNTVVVLLRKFDEWDPKQRFLPWALGFTKFEILAHRRDTARSRIVIDDSLLDAVTETWPEVTEEIDQEQPALQACLESLPPKSREMVQLRYFEELEMAEIAARVESTAGAVRAALLRIRRELLACVKRRLQSTGAE